MMIAPLLQTFAEAGTDTGKDVMIRLILFFMVAVIFFVLGFLGQQRRNGRGKWVKYVFGLLPMAACIWYTMDYFNWASSEFNISATGMNSSQETMYKASPFIALALAIGLVIIGIIADRRSAANVGDVL